MKVKITNDGLIVADKGVAIGAWKKGLIANTPAIHFNLWKKTYALLDLPGWRELVRGIALNQKHP